jgi:hypothetical protein
MSDDRRVLHRGSDRFLLVTRGSDVVGERLQFHDRDSARAFLAALASQPGNLDALHATAAATPGVPSGFGGRPSEGEWTQLGDALARGAVQVVRLLDHPIAPLTVTTTGMLTLSEVSWGETSGLYPTGDNLYKPDKWDQAKMCDLLRARAAVTDVATRNKQVRKAKPGPGRIEQMMRPYHCIENFPQKDVEIDEYVKWFYLSSTADSPLIHPGTSGTGIIKTYGPFHNIGGGDVPRGEVFLHFYKLV